MNVWQLASIPYILYRRGGLIITNTFEGGGLIETGGFFNLAKKTVSALHKELEYKVEKLKYKKLEVMQPRIKNKSDLPVGEVNHPGSVHTNFYGRD